jgi:hypothetical protein
MSAGGRCMHLLLSGPLFVANKPFCSHMLLKQKVV